MKLLAQFFAMAFVAVAASGCNDADVQAFFNNSAIAGDGVGLNLSEQPARSKAAESWMPTNYGYAAAPLKSAQLNKLEFDVLMPQSQQAMESFLGVPFAKDGDWHYWQLSDSDGAIASTELAVRYANGNAVEYSYVQN